MVVSGRNSQKKSPAALTKKHICQVHIWYFASPDFFQRKKLLKTNELVKVRMGDRGKVFRVKAWNTPEKKKNPINKKTKKGKNENKKVRFRQTSK